MLAFTANDRWQPGIGDPTFMGWLTVFAYFSACILCWKAALKARRVGSAGFWSRENLFWLLFSCFMLLLGINKQLDLQTWFTLFSKHLAQEEGWYEERRVFQLGKNFEQSCGVRTGLREVSRQGRRARRRNHAGGI